MSAVSASFPMSVADLDTPCLVIDLDAMERNLNRMADFARVHRVMLRPHAKMHKCAELALLQMRRGAVGVCVQKVSEAVALLSRGVCNIFISNEVIGLQKLQRLRQAMEANAPLQPVVAIAVDSLLGVERLALAFVDYPQSLDVFIELDVGHGRCGVQTGDQALLLAHAIGSHACLRFSGLQAYHGSAQHMRSADDRQTAITAAIETVKVVKSQLEDAGHVVGLVSGAGSGSFVNEARSGLYGELQCGSYLFMDRDYADNRVQADGPLFEHALFVKSQVMSVSDRHVVCDAGHKSHAVDSGLPRVWHPCGQTDLAFFNGGDEHGILRGETLPALGDVVWLVPGHCDPTVNLHDHMWGVRGGLSQGWVEQVFAVDARGAVT